MGSDLFIIQVGTPKSKKRPRKLGTAGKMELRSGLLGVHSDVYHGLICLSGEETKAQKKKQKHRQIK